MNKGELIKKVAEEAGVTAAQAGTAVNSVLDSISKTLTEGGEVRLVDFGSFSITERKARLGRNPKTGAEIQIPAKKTVKFKSSKKLGESVNV